MWQTKFTIFPHLPRSQRYQLESMDENVEKYHWYLVYWASSKQTIVGHIIWQIYREIFRIIDDLLNIVGLYPNFIRIFSDIIALFEAKNGGMYQMIDLLGNFWNYQWFIIYYWFLSQFYWDFWWYIALFNQLTWVNHLNFDQIIK